MPDDAYVRWPLPSGDKRYGEIDGVALKKPKVVKVFPGSSVSQPMVAANSLKTVPA